MSVGVLGCCLLAGAVGVQDAREPAAQCALAAQRMPGWKGALAGAIIGGALGAAFPPGENRNHGALRWGLTAAFGGVSFPTTAWWPVRLSSDEPRSPASPQNR